MLNHLGRGGFPLLWTATFLISCYGSPTVIKSEGEASPNSANSLAGDDTSGEEEVDEPVMVGGTFLTCAVAEDEIPPSDLQKVGVGCRVEDEKDGDKVAISDNIESSFTVYNVFNNKVTSDVEDAPADSQWHWYVRMPIDDFSDSNIEAKFVHKPTRYARVKTSKIAGEPILLPGRPIPVDQPVIRSFLGLDTDMHAGDIQDVNNASQASLSQECGSTMQTVEKSGKILRVRFTVPSAGTQIAINFGDLCGLTHTVQNPNTVSIARAASPGAYLTTANLTKDMKSGLLEGFEVGEGQEGEYVLTIAASKNQQGNFDDFIVGLIEFKTDKAIEVSMEDVEAEQLSATEAAQRSSIMVQLFGAPRDTSNETTFTVGVMGQGVTHYRYMLSSGNNAGCGDINAYGPEAAAQTPISVNIAAFADGAVRLCVIGKDAENFWQSANNASRASWIKDTRVDAPTLAGAPTNGSSDTKLNVAVVSNDVVQYKSKVIAGTDCASQQGYGEWVSKATPITTDIASIADGATVTLCVVGKDGLGNVQRFGNATKATWNKTAAAPATVNEGAGPDAGMPAEVANQN